MILREKRYTILSLLFLIIISISVILLLVLVPQAPLHDNSVTYEDVKMEDVDEKRQMNTYTWTDGEGNTHISFYERVTWNFHIDDGGGLDCRYTKTAPIIMTPGATSRVTLELDDGDIVTIKGEYNSDEDVFIVQQLEKQKED